MGDLINYISTAIVGIAGVFLFYKENKISKQTENESKQSEEWIKLYQELKEQSENKDAKIDKLYEAIEKLRKEIVSLNTRICAIDTENIKLQLLKCEKPKCADRDPQTGF